MSLTHVTSHWIPLCEFEDTWYNELFILSNYSHWLATFFFYVSAIYVKDVYLTFMSLGTITSIFLNIILKLLFRVPVPNGTCGYLVYFCDPPGSPEGTCESDFASLWRKTGNCSPCGMPSFEMQQVGFIVSSIFIYHLIWKVKSRLKALYEFLLVAWLALTAAGHVFIGFNSPEQTVLGSFIGILFACIYSLVMYAWLYYNKMYIYFQNTWLFTKLGPYTNKYLGEYLEKESPKDAKSLLEK